MGEICYIDENRMSGGSSTGHAIGKAQAARGDGFRDGEINMAGGGTNPTDEIPLGALPKASRHPINLASLPASPVWPCQILPGTSTGFGIDFTPSRFGWKRMRMLKKMSRGANRMWSRGPEQ